MHDDDDDDNGGEGAADASRIKLIMQTLRSLKKKLGT